MRPESCRRLRGSSRRTIPLRKASIALHLRIALWALLYMLSSAPDLEAAFKDADDREAARNFMDLLAASEGEGPDG